MRKFLVLFLFVSGGVCAQELDSLATDSLIKEPPEHLIGGFVFLGFSETPGPAAKSSSMRTVGAGIRYDKYEAGFSASFFYDSYTKRLIFPNLFNLIYAQGGPYFSYYLLESNFINAAPIVLLQFGDMIWERADTNEDFLREKFSLWQFGVKIESPYLRFLRPELILGYQTMSEMVLPDINRQKFTGFFVSFNVKVGYFNQ